MEHSPTGRRRPRALWIFGPVGSGKSRLLSRLSLNRFQRIDQDAALEKSLRDRGAALNLASYPEQKVAELHQLRAQIAAELWNKVPEWRRRGNDLVYETTGNKPHLFRIEVGLDQAHGYRILGIGIRSRLEQCLTRNAGRERVLSDAVVRETWNAFAEADRSGIYAQIFSSAELLLTEDAETALTVAEDWLRRE